MAGEKWALIRCHSTWDGTGGEYGAPNVDTCKWSSGRGIIKETQRRQYEGHNTPLGYYTDQGP